MIWFETLERKRELQEKRKRKRKRKRNQEGQQSKTRSSTSSIQAQENAEKLLKQVPERRGKKPFKSNKIWRMDHKPS